MPTVTVNVHEGSWTKGRRKRIYGRFEEVELDELTPRARAFAECVHQCPGHQPLDIRFESTRLERDHPHFAAMWGDGEEARERGARRIRMTSRSWANASWNMTAVEWLEDRARTAIPLDCYPIAPAQFDLDYRVPSWEAGAADRAVVRETVLEYLRDRGTPMGATAWDTLRGTGHLPAADRYVCGRPQWRPETWDAYIARPRQRWTVAQVAEALHVTSGGARAQLSRWGVTQDGQGGYPADMIQALIAKRPGRGRHGASRDGGRFTTEG